MILPPALKTRPLLLAALWFLTGRLLGSLALTPIAVLSARALRGRRLRPAALLVFAAAGSLSAWTAKPPVVLPRGLFVLEGVLTEVEPGADGAERMTLRLIGIGRIGQALKAGSGRVLATAPPGPCRSGDRVRILARTRTLFAAGFPGERPRPPLAWASVLRCLVIAPGSGPRRAVEPLRRRIRQVIDRTLPSAEAALVGAMVLGDRRRVPDAISRDFADAGLSHLLAVSGLHLAIVAGLFTVLVGGLLIRSALIRDGPGPRRPAAALGLGFVWLYTLLVGAPPSAVRAAVMVGLLLLADLVGRRREAWTALGLAALGMVAFEPEIVDEVSFQLSFCAVAALLLFRRPAPRRFSRPIRAILGVAYASAAATVGTAPLVVQHFGRVSLVGLAANLPATPLATLALVPVALIGALVAAVFEPVGAPILRVAGCLASVLAALAEWAAASDFATVAPTPLQAALFLAALVAWFALGRRKTAVLIAAGLALVSAVPDPAPLSADRLVVTFLPVGQGNAAVVETPGGRRMLVDAGPPGSAERVILPFLRHRGIERLDLVVLTHPHRDHTGGFAALARRVQIREVWHNGDRRDAPADLAGVRSRVVTATVTTFGRVGLEVLFGSPDAPTVNDGSLVLALRYEERRLLLAGDAEAAAEERMLASGLDLDADVLQLGHHGSHSSSTEAFLDAVTPTYAVASAGRDNRFNHPSEIVLQRLARRRISVFRTDRDGAVTVTTDGVNLRLEGFLRSHPPPRLRRPGASAP